MIDIRIRESVILASDFSALVAWYRDVLGFTVVQLFDEENCHYCKLRTASGVALGIADAAEVGVSPGDRASNTVVIQFEVDDIKAFFAHLDATGGAVTFGPSYDEKDKFWFGGFADPEGNPSWVVDSKCP